MRYRASASMPPTQDSHVHPINPPQKLSPQPHNKNSTTTSFLLSYNRPKSPALPSTFFKRSHRQNFLTIGKKFCKFRHPDMTHEKGWIE
jgi:hypothetical protein